MSASQRRILDEVRRDGVRVYNGRVRIPIKALEACGLVEVEWDHIERTKGNGIELAQRITVRPVDN